MSFLPLLRLPLTPLPLPSLQLPPHQIHLYLRLHLHLLQRGFTTQPFLIMLKIGYCLGHICPLTPEVLSQEGESLYSFFNTISLYIFEHYTGIPLNCS